MQGNVFIVGLGLIGGSIALAIKKEHPDARIIGYDIKQEEMQKASMLRVIDCEADSIQQGAEIADLIILSVPVLETEKLMDNLATFTLKDHVIVTDTGSTKKSIVTKSAVLTEKNICFIGGHPMAGSHKSGVTAAKDTLFENAFYILTPSTTETDLDTIKNWLSGTKAKFMVLSADEHDEMTGILSHFPHIIAASLVGQAKTYEKKYPSLTRLAAGGFRDITRIASSNPNMWTDISIRNKEVILSLLSEWIVDMKEIEKMIEMDDFEKIQSFFLRAKTFRDQLPIHTTGAIHSFYDLFVDVPDYPGVISEITGYLAEERISITNIRILETREDIYGVLRISFQNEKDRANAMECLKRRTTYDLFLQ